MGRSVQCCTCSKWVHLRCSLLSFSRFKTPGISHSWSCPPCCVPASSRGPTPTCTVSSSSDSSSLYTSTVQPGPSAPLLTKRFCSNLAFKLPTFLPLTSYLLPLHPPTFSCFWQFSYTSCFLFPTDLLRILQWNAGGLRARSAELLHFISSHPVNYICIQESNLNSSFSNRIPGYSALRSDRTHSWSGILSPDVMHASGGVIIFVRQGLSFSELSTCSLRLTPTLTMQGSTFL